MEEKVLCPKCGEGINEDFAICPYCGQELYDAETEELSEEKESEIEENYVELTENEVLVRKLMIISNVIKFIFYLGAFFFGLRVFTVDDEGLILPNIICAVVCIVMALVGTVFIEWMALTLETLDEIKNKKN